MESMKYTIIACRQFLAHRRVVRRRLRARRPGQTKVREEIFELKYSIPFEEEPVDDGEEEPLEDEEVNQYVDEEGLVMLQDEGGSEQDEVAAQRRDEANIREAYPQMRPESQRNDNRPSSFGERTKDQ